MEKKLLWEDGVELSPPNLRNLRIAGFAQFERSAPPGAPQAAANGADADLCYARDLVPTLMSGVRREAAQQLLNVCAPRSLPRRR